MGSKGANKGFDYNLIKVLDAVISAGNAAKAAKKLAITPAAVSLALRRLQNFYQQELFVRSKDGLLPTAKALEIHQSFRQAMSLVDNTFLPENKDDDTGLRSLEAISSKVITFSQLYGSALSSRALSTIFPSRNISCDKG